MVAKNIFLTLGLLCVLLGPAHAHDPEEDMAEAAKNFLASLDEAQKKAAVFEFKADERENFHFVPKDRQGLPVKAMKPEQLPLAYALLNSGLSTHGFAKATTIMSLEQILHELEGGAEHRDPGRYFFSVFGEPGEKGVWGWRCEGHHCSVNFTIVNGKFSATPNFFGANPGEVKSGPRQGLRVLADEEDRGRALVKSLDEAQQKVAILSDRAPSDIFTGAQRKIDPLSPGGLAASALSAEQKQSLRALIDTYLRRARAEVADAEWKQIEAAGFDAIHFAWMGGLEKGQGHYYRVQGPTFLLEYDNTQGGANHPHTVWREFNGDFGRDILAEHYQNADHEHGHDHPPAKDGGSEADKTPPSAGE